MSAVALSFVLSAEGASAASKSGDCGEDVLLLVSLKKSADEYLSRM